MRTLDYCRGRAGIIGQAAQEVIDGKLMTNRRRHFPDRSAVHEYERNESDAMRHELRAETWRGIGPSNDHLTAANRATTSCPRIHIAALEPSSRPDARLMSCTKPAQEEPAVGAL